MIKNPKNKILVSFSGGETSSYMINWLLKNKQKHEYKFVFANTGEENEETLIFVQQVAEYFNIDIAWVEYERLGYKEVNFETAYRSHNPIEIANGWQNHPFRKYISHFGIPNITNNSCSRELKEYTIRRYMRSIGWKNRDYDIAIGIRADEIDRVGNHYYPLVKSGITKPMINSFWNNMPFRLELKGYEGNCKTCWKKSYRKLITISRENPHHFDFMKQMEFEYENYVKEERKNKEKIPVRFFREYKTVNEIFEMAKDLKIENAKDDSKFYNYQTSIFHDGTELDISNGCVESCEVF